MISALAIEESAAETLVSLPELPEAIWNQSEAHFPDLRLKFVKVQSVFYVLGPRATAESTLVIFPLSAGAYFGGIPEEVRSTVVQRCMRAATTARRPGRFLPRSWAPFHSPPYTIFYSTTIAMGQAGMSARSVLQTSPEGTPHVLICAYIEGDPPDLKQYRTPSDASKALVEADLHLSAALGAQPALTVGHEFSPVAPYDAPVQGRSLTEWVPLLTREQTTFLGSKLVGPTKIRGGAGTGKTLALMLKAVTDLYEASDSGASWRGLLVTHNWVTAEAIRVALPTIDERNLLGVSTERTLEVSTLQALATNALQLNSPNAQPISEDGHDGKIMQVEMIEGLVAEFRTRDWPIYRSACSDRFRTRMEAARDTPDARLLAWDLMNEFACVISASRAMTSDSYQAAPRRPWMMPLVNASEREVAYLLHERFRHTMHEEMNALTIYDVINDYLRLLDTNSWLLRRRKEGYDAILVDEFHLFNKQEMLVFQHLSKDPHRLPPAVLAMDPRQSPTEAFLGFKADKKHPINRAFEKEKVTEVRFEQVFRYTSEINAVLGIIEQCFFGFALEEEDESMPRHTSASGPKPQFWAVPTLSRALDQAFFLAQAAARERQGGAAILCLAPESFTLMTRRLGVLQKERDCVFVGTRDSSEALARLGRKVLVSQPEYVAGAQFDTVVIVDANEGHVRAGADEQLHMRRLLSGLYLGLSRAKRQVHVLSSDADGGLLRFLRPAVEGNLVESQRI